MSNDVYHRYQTDPRFHVLVDLAYRWLDQFEGDFTTGEMRQAFTLALERREMLRVRPALAPETLPGPDST